ncbi:hypothetical protein CNR22_06695 [Sphingobacteriaceae bacterium]|nr:hypothetical protein CNR22_06695 [Sphingobacteriaceae bacterium]
MQSKLNAVKHKKWLLLVIIAFPSLFWLILETSTINSRRLPIYGPKKVIAAGDTSFYKVSDRFYTQKSDSSSELVSQSIDTSTTPLYAIMFIKDKYRDDAYRLTGLWEYLNYKKQKVEHIPFVLVTEHDGVSSKASAELKKLSYHENVHFYVWKKSGFDSIVKSYFAEKPYYIDYSFFMLIDGKRRVRGYYDARYVSEIKRLIDEYQHLRLKEEKQKLIETNEIKSNS